jgi:hypothetical protein
MRTATQLHGVCTEDSDKPKGWRLRLLLDSIPVVAPDLARRWLGGARERNYLSTHGVQAQNIFV